MRGFWSDLVEVCILSLAFKMHDVGKSSSDIGLVVALSKLQITRCDLVQPLQAVL